MPTYPDELVQVALIHSMVNGPEMAINTFHLRHHHEAGNTFDWATDLPLLATAIRDKYEAATHWAHYSTQYKFQQAKCSQIGTDGKVTRTAIANSTVTGGKAGTNTNPALPYEVAAVVSIRTDTPGSVVSNPRTGPNPSRQRRGRFYLSGLTSDIMDATGNGLFDATAITNLGGQLLAFLNNVQGVHVGGLVPPNTNYDWMNLGVASGVSGEFYQADRIVIDRVPDAQRRRRNRQKQTGYTGTIAHS